MNEDDQTNSSSSKSNSGRPESLVWNHFYKKIELGSRGHFSATCHYCNKEWSRGKPDILEDHLATECIYCSDNIHNDYLEIVSKRIVANNKEKAVTSTIKKRKSETLLPQLKQTGLEDFLESTKLSDTRRNNINTALGRFFVTCSIPFAVADHPFFIEFCKQLRPAYEPPSRTTISNNILHSEAATITIKILKELQNEENITIALDGWTDPNNRNLYNFVLMTSNRHEYLWAIEDVSSESITGDFLTTQIEKIINNIGQDKIAGLITDGAANCKMARRLIKEKYPRIITMWCIAHHLNLISKDICKHEFALSTINKCQTLVSFFSKSHQGMATLRSSISNLQIKGGGIKTSTKTRWSTIYDCCESIVRLRSAFEDVSIKINN
jgi:Protein of unknown function (DUF 659)/BED zinc finger